MATNPLHEIQIPGARTGVLQPEGVFTPSWYKFFYDFFTKTAQLIDVAQLMSQIGALETAVSQLAARNERLTHQLANMPSVYELEALKARVRTLEYQAGVAINANSYT